MQMDKLAAEHLPLVRPCVFPERLALAREGARRIDFVPGAPWLAGELPDLGKRQRLLASVARQVGYAGRRPARVRAAAVQPFAELLERPRVVVVPLLFVEEWIEVRVGVEGDADEQLGMVAREGHDHARRCLEVAPLVMPILR